jgi:hypothetical protein
MNALADSSRRNHDFRESVVEGVFHVREGFWRVAERVSRRFYSHM